MHEPGVNDPFAGSGSSESARERYLSSLGHDYGEFVLGQNTTRILNEDPKLLLFTLARYKFVSKMFAGFSKVLEVGCHEGWGLPVVLQNVERMHAIDFFKSYVDSCERRIHDPRVTFEAYDFLDGPIGGDFDGAFALDVLEHIEPASEHAFMSSLAGSLRPDGTAIIGIPSLESQAYASPASKAGHINCKSGEQLRSMMNEYFTITAMFSMNDEVLHTGFFPMSQYLFAMGSIPRRG